MSHPSLDAIASSSVFGREAVKVVQVDSVLALLLWDLWCDFRVLLLFGAEAAFICALVTGGSTFGGDNAKAVIA